MKFFIMIIVVTICLAAISFMGRSKGKNTTDNNQTEDGIIKISVQPPGGWTKLCDEYSTLNISWDKHDSARVNTDELITTLLMADISGNLFCDCRDKNKNHYASAIGYLVPLANGCGICIELKPEIFLEKEEAIAKIQKLLHDQKKHIFYAHPITIS